MRYLLKHGVLFLIYGAICSFIVVLFVYINQMQSRPDLQVWHSAELDEEFTARQSSEIKNLTDYVQLENRLFDQLREKVYARAREADKRQLNRYSKGSLADPQSYKRDWNRSFEFTTPNPKGGVLLIHGLSDSPYSMRSIAKLFKSMGFWVVGLRLPGHGTAPSGLVTATWQDFAAATEIAARDVKSIVGDKKPFYMVGFSTGAALSVEYSLEILAGKTDNPLPDGLVLLSPAIGVTPLAAFAVWQSRLARIHGLEKMAWESIQPEYDPFRYKSFAVNAGDQIYQLTSAINRYVKQLDTGNGIKGFPKVLAFQSVVDATVTTPALVSGLFNHLTGEEHELVLFDINRNAEAEPFMMSHPEAATIALLKDRDLPFLFTVVTNVSSKSNEVMIRQKQVNSETIIDTPLESSWPEGVFSLSHSALPFSPIDPLYGIKAIKKESPLYLGRINLQGEKGVLLIPSDELLRLRFNPFYDYVERRTLEFAGG